MSQNLFLSCAAATLFGLFVQGQFNIPCGLNGYCSAENSYCDQMSRLCECQGATWKEASVGSLAFQCTPFNFSSYNSTTDLWTCPDGLQGNASWESCCPPLMTPVNGTCNCINNLVELETTGACGCPSNMVLHKNSCKCPSHMVFNGTGCSCPSPMSFNGVGCSCPWPMVINGVACSCPSPMVSKGDSCSCPSPMVFNGVVCSCPSPKVFNRGGCSCPSPMVSNGVGCSCPSPMVSDRVGCSCPSNLQLNQGVCKCPYAMYLRSKICEPCKYAFGEGNTYSCPKGAFPVPNCQCQCSDEYNTEIDIVKQVLTCTLK